MEVYSSMDGKKTWDKILSALGDRSVEIATVPSIKREPLWFIAQAENGAVCVSNAGVHVPSCSISTPRKITMKDFLAVYDFYHRWANGETDLRQKTRLISRNTAYIFALIKNFEG